jgi:hypothetical protein
MRAFAFVLLAALGGCAMSVDDYSGIWYDRAEVVCYRPACPRCAGSGHVGCGPCGARGWNRCTSCSGGRVRCGTCKGSGQHKEKACKSCGGSGQQTCGRCGGDQRIDCDVCSGRARLQCLRPLPITEPKPSAEDTWPRKTAGSP